MELKYSVNKVIENCRINENIFMLTIKGSFEADPGQFYMLRAWDDEPFLSRPISVHDVCEEGISFVYQVKGSGTELLSKLKHGDDIKLTGPIGKGFDVENIRGKVAIVTGGLGIAPMMLTVKKLEGCIIDVYAGFRDKAFLLDDMKEYVEGVYAASETGNCGTKGYVTDIFDPWEYSAVLCCGPEVMMEKIVKKCRIYATPVYVSMEKQMACGVGACLGCSCEVKGENKRVCVDGPVFSGRDVILSA